MNIKDEVQKLPQYYECDRCGQQINADAVAKRRSRGDNDLRCLDCRGRPLTKLPTYNGVKCKPWEGDIDLDTLAPIDEKGNLAVPGIRKCGNADCVENRHIVNTLELVAEQFGNYHLVGWKRNYHQLLLDLTKELMK